MSPYCDWLLDYLDKDTMSLNCGGFELDKDRQRNKV